jgi:hypothetical protein
MKSIFTTLSLAIIMIAMTSCGETQNPFLGLYHSDYTPESSDAQRLELDMRIAQVNDSTYDAQLAVRHFFKKSLLFTDLTSDFKIGFSEDMDTMKLLFTLPADTVDVEWAPKEPRNFDLVFVINPDNNNLELVSSSNNEIVPDFFLTFNRALNATDSAKIDISRRRPKFVYRDEHAIYGDVEKVIMTKPELYNYTCIYSKEGIFLSYDDPYEHSKNVIKKLNDSTTLSITFSVGRMIYHYDNDNILRRQGKPGDKRGDVYHYDIYGRLAKIEQTDYYFKRRTQTLYYDKHGFVEKITNVGTYNEEHHYTPTKFDEMGNVIEYKLERYPYVKEFQITYYK